MTAFLLIRHASHGWLGKVLVGRQPGIPLSEKGEAEASDLAENLRSCRVEAVYTSPSQRCRQTAAEVARRWHLNTEILPGLNEIDVGVWTGRSFQELEEDPRWQHWNASRAAARAPGGESMGEVQARVLETLRRLACVHPDGVVAIVSHADVIKAALLYFLGISLDDHHTVDVLPAKVTLITYDSGSADVLLLNDPGAQVCQSLAEWHRTSHREIGVPLQPA